MVQVKDELAFVNDYISISKSNYGENSIIYTVDIPREYQNLYVPTLAFNILLALCSTSVLALNNSIETFRPHIAQIFIRYPISLFVS